MKVESYEAKVRITDLRAPVDRLIQTCLKYSDPESLIIVREVQPIIHYHLYLKLQVAKPTWLKELKKLLPPNNEVKGNGVYSQQFEHHDWDVYRGYLFKFDDTEIVYMKNQVLIPEYKKAYEAHKGGNKENQFKKKEHTRKLEWIVSKLPENPNRDDIITAVLEFYSTNAMPFHKAHICQMVHLINHQLLPTCTAFKNIIHQECFPEHFTTTEQELSDLPKANTQYRIHFRKCDCSNKPK